MSTNESNKHLLGFEALTSLAEEGIQQLKEMVKNEKNAHATECPFGHTVHEILVTQLEILRQTYSKIELLIDKMTEDREEGK
jgi:hypothetical protein